MRESHRSATARRLLRSLQLRRNASPPESVFSRQSRSNFPLWGKQRDACPLISPRRRECPMKIAAIGAETLTLLLSASVAQAQTSPPGAPPGGSPSAPQSKDGSATGAGVGVPTPGPTNPVPNLTPGGQPRSRRRSSLAQECSRRIRLTVCVRRSDRVINVETDRPQQRGSNWGRWEDAALKSTAGTKYSAAR